MGKGYKIAIETLNEGRIAIGGQMTGLAQGALNHALAYAKQRKQFGKAIAEYQAIQLQLAEMATELEAARLLVYNAARLREAGRPFLKEAAMAKYFSSTVAETIASRAVEILGGVGFTKDYPVEKCIATPKSGESTRAPATCSESPLPSSCSDDYNLLDEARTPVTARVPVGAAEQADESGGTYGEGAGRIPREVHHDEGQRVRDPCGSRLGSAGGGPLLQPGEERLLRRLGVSSSASRLRCAVWACMRNPAIQAKWQKVPMKDEKVIKSNLLGWVGFAAFGADSRTTQIYISLKDNKDLDRQGFPPFGEVSRGIGGMARIYGGYSDKPAEPSILKGGAAYLKRNFPLMDYVVGPSSSEQACAAGRLEGGLPDSLFDEAAARLASS